jgi:hypothetical protein
MIFVLRYAFARTACAKFALILLQNDSLSNFFRRGGLGRDVMSTSTIATSIFRVLQVRRGFTAGRLSRSVSKITDLTGGRKVKWVREGLVSLDGGNYDHSESIVS